jgi:hypothetical protein
MKLAGQIVLVTGGGRGHTLVRAFAVKAAFNTIRAALPDMRTAGFGRTSITIAPRRKLRCGRPTPARRHRKRCST